MDVLFLEASPTLRLRLFAGYGTVVFVNTEGPLSEHCMFTSTRCYGIKTNGKHAVFKKTCASVGIRTARRAVKRLLRTV
ncbi:hypothetical protein AB6A40_005425 [Gnathostoma spinigerum]|uniref:Ribosomal protein S11 n=1 Tax=Gnathostoma spinigerum TaxID=75299 RepID=A0ABD6EMR4_9BILA